MAVALRVTPERSTRPVRSAGRGQPAVAPRRRDRDVTLTVVAAPEQQPLVRRLFGVFVVLFVVLALVVGLRTYMAQQQMTLDKLSVDVSRARNYFDELRAERSQLRSPEVLVRAAGELGMVQAPIQAKFVEIPPEVAADVAATVGTIDGDTLGRGTVLSEWGELKSKVHGAP